jgi:peptidoglycan-N-acetylglucosamine deacetylase
MTSYWVKAPEWLKKIFPKGLIWDMPATEQPSVYLTFDDGPHPTITQFILDQLAIYNAKATFFCIGKNVVLYPEPFRKLIDAGHTVANHTHNHLNGWNTSAREYIDNIQLAAQHIQSHAFRPPYGRIRRSQVKKLTGLSPDWRIYMWDVLSADFDMQITPQKCLDNVLDNIRPGSIIVFHDSDKAWERMSYALPRVLEHCQKQNWQMKALPQN